MSQMGTYSIGVNPPGTFVETLTGDIGGAVGPDGSGNINVITDNANNNSGATFLVNGTPVDNTLTIITSDVNNNTQIGFDAGNSAQTGARNTGLGTSSLSSITSGSNNTAIGSQALTLAQDAETCVAVGVRALSSKTTGFGAVAVGYEALIADVLPSGGGSNSGNTAVGYRSGHTVSTGIGNAFVGFQSGFNVSTGVLNCLFGAGAGGALSTGSRNVGLGSGAFSQITSGSYNIGIGFQAGSLSTLADSSNIFINNQGAPGISNTLMIGSGTGIGNQSLSTTIIHGINGVTTSNSMMVTIDSVTSQLGTAAIPSGGLSTLTGDVGSAASGSNIDIKAGLAANNSGATVFFESSGSTVDFNVSDPVLGNTFVGYLAGSTTTTSQQNTSLGISTLASIDNASYQNTAVGFQCMDIAPQPNANVAMGYQALRNGGAGNVAIGSGAMSLSATDAQASVAIGLGAGQRLAGSDDTAVGRFALQFQATPETGGNTAVGSAALQSFNGTGVNTAVGADAFATLTSGNGNVAVGLGTGRCTTGSFNIVIGDRVGSAWTAAESSNILLNSPGVVSETSTLRIGKATGTGDQELQASFIHGIYGVLPPNATRTVIIDTDGQLGTGPAVDYLLYVQTAASTYVVDPAIDDYISVDCTGGAVTVQLPDFAPPGTKYVVKDRLGSAAANNITVTTPGGTVLIDGATTFVMNTNYQSAQFIFGTTAYEIY